MKNMTDEQMQKLRADIINWFKPFSMFGAALAITISWSLYKSVLWAILHGIFSWFYVLYYIMTK